MATQGIFMLNDCLHKQIDGMTMGSPLGPTLANFFMGQLEEKIFGQNIVTRLFLIYRKQTVGDTVSYLTGPGFKPQTSGIDKIVLTSPKLYLR